MGASRVPIYFRPAAHLYAIKSHPTYDLFVGCQGTQQVMWGLGATLWFSSDGYLQRVEGGLDRRSAKAVPPAVADPFAPQAQSIQVRRFWAPQAEAGIEDYGEDLQEFLSFPSSFDAEETKELRGALEEWESTGMFSLWWGARLDVDETGEVEAS